MGWNGWAQYQCGYSARTIIENARALVRTGLAARGYATVTIDDCWMQKTRGAGGALQVDTTRFPQGMQPVIEAVHALGLKFGIYEDAGYATCGGFAGSGEPKGGGEDHFLQDARLFRSWGVDYLKLDGCNVRVGAGETKAEAYRRAYAKESAALMAIGRPVIFSESAPAYFMDTPEWYDVLGWVGDYGQLWREGTDIEDFHKDKADFGRFPSVLWNYAYNLPLGRFQRPGNWNDPDFVIAGGGMSLAENRSQMALWSMMSSPLILSADVSQLGSAAAAILGNKAVIAIDQDRLGRMANLIRRSRSMDVLLKPLADGDFAVAVFNRGATPVRARLAPADLGFARNVECRFDAWDLWSGGRHAAVSALDAKVMSHDTMIWRVRPSTACGVPMRVGAIVMTVPGKPRRSIEAYGRCLAATGVVEPCKGTPAESWTVTATGGLVSGGRCLAAVVEAAVVMKGCAGSGNDAQRWRYTRGGELVNEMNGECLTATHGDGGPGHLRLAACGHHRADQIWSLPNPLSRNLPDAEGAGTARDSTRPGPTFTALPLHLTRMNEGHGVTASLGQRVGNAAAALVFFAQESGPGKPLEAAR